MSDPSIDDFTTWFLSTMPPIWAVPFGTCVWKVEDVTVVLLYRQPPFQVQLFIVPPHYIIPEHTHPNVDSIEIYVGGDIKFSHSGKWVVPDEAFAGPSEQGTWQKRGKRIRVKPNDQHGGQFGPHGGVFMSSQRWMNGVEPHCVSADYTGVVMGPHHFEMVKDGHPILSDQKLAASLEC
jgi:hypothetical protein